MKKVASVFEGGAINHLTVLDADILPHRFDIETKQVILEADLAQFPFHVLDLFVLHFDLSLLWLDLLSQFLDFVVQDKLELF